MRFLRRSAAVLAAAALLASCSSAAPSGDASIAAEQISVIAATNVWGDIAQQVGGEHVSVTSLIEDPSQDPHTFQPSGRDELAVSRADVVIVNGGGYDDFLLQMLSSVGTRATVVTATEAAADVPSFDPDNEHLWLNVDAVQAVAGAIGTAFAKRDPALAQEFHTNTATFDASLDPIRASIDAVAARYSGVQVAVTEPLPDYLLRAAGLDNVTPPSFTEAMEEGVDVSPSDLATVLALFDDHQVKLLAFNEQSASSQAEQVLAAARRNQIPVLPVTELLPGGERYQRWMASLVDDLRGLLSGEDAT